MATTAGGDTAGKVKRECRVVFNFEGKTICDIARVSVSKYGSED